MKYTQSFHGASIPGISSLLLSLPRHVIFLVQYITAQIFLGENSVVKVCYLFCLFVHPFSHTCNIGHVNDRLHFVYYNTTCNIWTSTHYNVINKNTKFKDQFEVEFVTTNRNMCVYLYIYTYELRIEINVLDMLGGRQFSAVAHYLCYNLTFSGYCPLSVVCAVHVTFQYLSLLLCYVAPSICLQIIVLLMFLHII